MAENVIEIKEMTVAEWERIQKWAEAQLRAEGTPWAGYQYMKLIDAIDAITDGYHFRMDEEELRSETPSPSGSSDAASASVGCFEDDS